MVRVGLWGVCIVLNPDLCVCMCVCLGVLVVVGMAGLPQVPAPHVRRTPVPTWASVFSSGKTTPATAL